MQKSTLSARFQSLSRIAEGFRSTSFLERGFIDLNQSLPGIGIPPELSQAFTPVGHSVVGIDLSRSDAGRTVFLLG